MLRQAGRFSAVGIEMALAIVVGILGGRYLDQKFDTKPILLLVGAILGLGAAVKAVIDATKAAKKAMTDNASSNAEKD